MIKYLSILTLLFPLVLNAQKQYTFKVDVSTIPSYSKKAKLNLGLRGSVTPLSWVKGIKLNDDDNDGIYETTVNFIHASQEELYFKFVLNEVEWEEGDAHLLTLRKDTPQEHQFTFKYKKPRENPFKKFVGEWTLKDDKWQQGETAETIDTIYLPNHYTLCKEINTGKSLFWIVEATSAKGHALWTYNAATEEVFMQSSFYADRIGLGSGSINTQGDVFLEMIFEGNEPEGTYRKYSYEWINDDEYILKSYRYNKEHKPTGNFYGGTFIRIKNE